MDDELFDFEAWTPRLIVGWLILDVTKAAHFCYNGEFLCRRYSVPAVVIAAPPGYPLCKTCAKYLLAIKDSDIPVAVNTDSPVDTKPNPSPNSQEKPPAVVVTTQDEGA